MGSAGKFGAASLKTLSLLAAAGARAPSQTRSVLVRREAWAGARRKAG